MIIEMRTYTLKPGNIPTFEERFGGALAIGKSSRSSRRSGTPRWGRSIR